jgi:GMP synthase-like glutamine amidotransferase
MILLIQINNIPFHYYEFVKPIEEIIKKSGFPFSSIHYEDLKKTHLTNADRIIIAGTSLKDNAYLKDARAFKWMKTFQHPILGICGGMQLIAMVFDESIRHGQEIGLHTINFHRSFLGEVGEKEGYMLHNNYVEPILFETIATSDQFPQIIKHPKKPFYGVLFHPEVRNKQMITSFITDKRV